METTPTPRGGTATARLVADDLTLGYGSRTISEHLGLAVPDGSFTVIVGPNACGKSTLLRSLARLLAPMHGQVLLDGTSLADRRPKEVARAIGLLPQTSIAPEGVRVVDLVGRGRFPHQGVVRRWGEADELAVREAMAATDITELAERSVDELSGGQRQRVWAAMAIAQSTPILLLDEPTTYLDIRHQIELLDVFSRLNRAGRTIVAVLHDLNQACRYADHLVVMKDGEVVVTGHPAEVLTADLVEDVYGLPCLVIDDPVSHTPLVVPTAGDFAPRGGRDHG